MPSAVPGDLGEAASTQFTSTYCVFSSLLGLQCNERGNRSLSVTRKPVFPPKRLPDAGRKPFLGLNHAPSPGAGAATALKTEAYPDQPGPLVAIHLPE